MLANALRSDPSLALATDLYELSMGQAYWKNEMTGMQAEYHMFYRQNPFGGGYVVWAGLEGLIEVLTDFRYSAKDLAYLETLKTKNETPLFDKAFLDYLEGFRFTCDVDAVAEGSIVFPNEPLIRVRGPIMEAQVVETLLLNTVNFQSLIATKAARTVQAAEGDPVIDFGLRRAQGLDGGFSASRAAYLGGCLGTSNVLAGKVLGIPVLGTFAHSWVMSFESESESFEAFARAMPDNCVFLVDTYNSLRGIEKAIESAGRLRARGHEMVGVRLDSGDLTWLSIQARQMLDKAGYPEALVMASGDLDEWLIRSMKSQGAKINAWGVGTRLVTAHGDPALGGVYKLSAVQAPGQEGWDYKLKISEQKFKTSIPGVVQIYRCSDAKGKFIADAVIDDTEDPHEVSRIIDPNDNTKTKSLKKAVEREPLLLPIMKAGRPVSDTPSIGQIRSRVTEQLSQLDPGHQRFEYPHLYPVGLSPRLNNIRDEMIAQARTSMDNGGG